MLFNSAVMLCNGDAWFSIVQVVLGNISLYGYGVVKLCNTIVKELYGQVMFRKGFVLKYSILMVKEDIL